MAKKEDPLHPSMTVIAEIGDDKVKKIHDLCKSIDIIGINSYGGAFTVRERYLKQGGTKPYVITEFGPLGPWEVQKTPWGAPIEHSSTEKAEFYRKAYKAAVQDAPGLCLGSYVFLWGQKQEATATWFGMFLENGQRLEATDTMKELWTGKQASDKCPKITTLSISPADGLKPGQTIRANLVASDPEGKKLSVKWLLKSEAKVRLTAGQSEPKVQEYPDAVRSATTTHAEVTLPSQPGEYRLFAYVSDPAGGAAVTNIPLRTSQNRP